MRRALIFSGSFTLLAALTIWWLTPSPRELRYSAQHELYGFVDARTAQGLGTSGPVLTLLSQLAPAAQRAQARQQAAAPSASREIALGCGFAQPRWEWRDGPAGDTDKVVRTLPTVALQQLSALTNGYLLLRSEQPATVAADTRIRRWLGVGMSDSIGEAKALTIAIGEDSLAGRAQVGLCLEFGRAEDALAAVKRIETQSAGGVIQFAVNPQAENVARQHRLVVVRFEVGAAYLMLAAKPR